MTSLVSWTLCLLLSVHVVSGRSDHHNGRHNRKDAFGYFRRSASSDDDDPLERSSLNRGRSRVTDGQGLGDGLRLNMTGVRLANEHLVEIRTNHRCGHPRSRLVRVRDFYPSAEKVYLPRVTLLHKCDDESGCCENDAFHCAAKSQQPVNMYFYVVMVNNGSSVEMLTFTNDTECECRELNHQPRNMAAVDRQGDDDGGDAATVKSIDLSTGPVTGHMLPASSVTGSTRATWLVTIAPVTPPPVGQDTNPTGLRLPVTPKEEKVAQLDKEKAILCSHIFCPNPFSAKLVTKYQPTTRCTCDCPHGDHHCLKIKRGTARLSPTEAQCVRRLDCMEPECTFPGAFDKTSGRCPRSADHGKLKHHQNRFRHQKHYLHERD